jgi:hypothetical protein
MWLKLLRSVVLIRGIWNAGMAFVRVLSRLSSFGRYAFCLYYYAFPTDQPMSRIGHQAVILKPYPAITHTLLLSVCSAFPFGVYLD